MSKLTRMAELVARNIVGLIIALAIPQAISRGAGQTEVVALVVAVTIWFKPHLAGLIRGIFCERTSFSKRLEKGRRNR